uniref:dCMP deaminase n=1 Tax=Megaselia scalaris TaxID=36166 RepID=T1GFP9_MEGSC
MSSGKRQDYISWDDYFMSTAILSAKRSKDPSTQVGACIVDDNNRIVSIGYNGFPRNCHDDIFPWTKDNDDPIDCKNMYVVHAEANAILNAINNKYSEKPAFRASRKMLDYVGIKCTKFSPKQSKVVIDFTEYESGPNSFYSDTPTKNH